MLLDESSKEWGVAIGVSADSVSHCMHSWAAFGDLAGGETDKESLSEKKGVSPRIGLVFMLVCDPVRDAWAVLRLR